MRNIEGLEAEIKELIIEALVLEDLTPDDIESEKPLFVEGLGLDSLDALEIAMILEERYGVVTPDDDQENQKHFATVRSLAEYVAERRAK